MNRELIGDDLHRLVKLAMDSGEVSTLEQAKELFAGYQLGLEIGPDVATSPTMQAAVLTAVNTGRRCFLGGVQVVGNLDVDLRVPWRKCRTLAEAVIDLQGKVVKTVTPTLPRIVFGDVDSNTSVSTFVVRATFEGWAGGVIPFDDVRRLPEQHEFTPSGVLAGALAVSEAFQFVRGGNAQAGRREVGLSLWRPEEGVSWLEDSAFGPPLEHLPSKLWLIGLGHLGQAYLWTLGFLPYAQPDEVQIVLQDYDTLVRANDSTSLLTSLEILGEKKTRATENWCEERGFRTAIQERRFDANFGIDSDEPQVALCGVDNPMARAALEDVGFGRNIEAGLGGGTQEYLALQVHTFPSRQSARKRWGSIKHVHGVESIVRQLAYQILATEGLDQCGLTMLAGRSVGASFVGATTAAIVIAELLRLVMGAHRYEVIDGTLRSLKCRQAVQYEGQDDPFNPGYTMRLEK